MTNQRDRLQAALNGRYVIERELGRGGMATVYLAEDVKHHRRVAIKVLRPELAASLGPERFLREIETAARLTHPHILPLHDSGDAAGLLYFVMPYVEGESLRDRLNRERQLAVADALQIARDVAEALSCAHDHDIVHRDIKPENILLEAGHAVVSDFGIARAITVAGRESLTATGISVGTPAYMSPEQASAQGHVDGRADIYALGCVVYELLAGHPPFLGSTAQEVLARHRLDPVPALHTIRPELPAAVEHAVQKALAKTPADRFATAAVFSAALATPPPAPLLRSSVRPALYVAIAAAVLIAAYALRSRPPTPGGATVSGASLPSLAVLPFVNIGADPNNEPFSDGMSEELTTALAKVEGLSVAARTSAFSFKGKNVDVRDIASRLGVSYVLEGSVRKASRRLRVSAQLINAANGYHLWSDEYERDDRDAFAVQDEITRAIVGALRGKLTLGAGVPLVRRSTDSPEAHDLYLQGRYFYERRDEAGLKKAKDYFERAVRKDSLYALAYAGLSDAYSLLSVFGFGSPRAFFPLAKAAALRAVRLDSTLVEAHTSLAFIHLFYDWDWSASGQEFDRALALDPRYPRAHLFHGWYYVAAGRMPDAIRETKRAVELDPLSLINNTRLGTMFLYEHRYDEALAQARHALELDSSYLPSRELAATDYVMLNQCDEALAVIERGPAFLGQYRGTAGWAYAKCGRRAQALAEREKLRADAKAGLSGSHYSLAMIEAGLSDTERTFAELDSGYRDRDGSMFMLRADPLFDRLRSEPRFARLLEKLGLSF